MIARVATAFVALAAATATVSATAVIPRGYGDGKCNTGSVQCCNSVHSSSSDMGTTILSLLGIVLDGPKTDIGLDCSPLSVIGVGSGNACSAHTVCCQNTSEGGLIGIGCVPIFL